MYIGKYQETPYQGNMALPDLNVHRRAQTRVGIKKMPNCQGFYSHSRDSGTADVKNRIKSQYLMKKERQLNSSDLLN